MPVLEGKEEGAEDPVSAGYSRDHNYPAKEVFISPKQERLNPSSTAFKCPSGPPFCPALSVQRRGLGHVLSQTASLVSLLKSAKASALGWLAKEGGGGNPAATALGSSHVPALG